MPFHHAAPLDVVVAAGGVTTVTIAFDSGIREILHTGVSRLSIVWAVTVRAIRRQTLLNTLCVRRRSLAG